MDFPVRLARPVLVKQKPGWQMGHDRGTGGITVFLSKTHGLSCARPMQLMQFPHPRQRKQ